MPLRGESIGVAYVKILADGEDFGDDVRRALRDADGDFRQLGRTHSLAYEEGFEEQEDRIGKNFVTGIEAGIRRNSGRMDAVADQLSSDLFDPIEKQFKHRFGSIGEEMFQELREGFRRSGGDPDFIDNFIENIEREVENSTNRITKIQDAAAKHAERERQKQIKEIENFLDADLAATKKSEKAARDAAEAKTRQVRKATADQINLLKSLRSEVELLERQEKKALNESRVAWNELTNQVNSYFKQVDSTHASRRQLISELHTLGDRVRSAGGATKTFERNFKDLDFRLRSTHPFLQRFNNSMDLFADKTSKAFGKGARNNFFNLFGVITGFFVGLPGLVGKGLQGVLTFASGFKDAFTEGGVFGVLKKVAGGVTGLVVGIGGLAVVMGGVVIIAGVLSSALLALLGSIVAVAGSLTFALGGAIAVVAGALVPLAAGIGVAVLAFQNLTKEQKKAFDGIGKAFKGLGKDAAKNIFDSPVKDAKALEDAIKGLSKIIDPVSKALGGLLDEFIEDLGSPLFKNFEKFLGKVLPDMVTSLGGIFGNIGASFVGIFRAIAPSVQEFLGWLDDITGKFAEWTNSTEGKQTIKDFLDRAKESAIAVGDALGSVIGLIADLFDASKHQGDNLFSDLSKTIEDWRVQIQQAAEDGTLQQWFKDAKNTTEEIGKAVVAIGKFIAALDTPENRQLVKDLADGFVDLVGFIQKVAPVLEDLTGVFAGLFKPAIDGIKKLDDAWKKVGDVFTTVYNSVLGPVFRFILRNISGLIEAVADFFGALSHAPGFGWAGKLADSLHHAADEAENAAEKVRSIDTDIKVSVEVLAPSQATIDKINAQLGQIHTRISVPVTIPTSGGGGGGGGGGGNNSDQRVSSSLSVLPVGASGKVVNVGTINLITPTQDPAAAAQEVVNRIAAAAYI